MSHKSLFQRDLSFAQQSFTHRDFKIILFALSMATVSNDARYMRVVAAESCPIPSLITESGTFLLLAMLALA